MKQRYVGMQMIPFRRKIRLPQSVGVPEYLWRQFRGNDERFERHMLTIPLGAADWEGGMSAAPAPERRQAVPGSEG